MFGVLRPPSPPERSTPLPSSSPPPANSLAPMPPRDFASREDVLAGSKDWAASQGYAIVIARSRFNRLWLKCDRGGTYENRRNLTQGQRKRKRGDSRLLGCPFRMLATVKKNGTWRVETDVPQHNHGPSDDLSMHPTLRRLNGAQLVKVHEMYDAGRSPAETVEELKVMWPDIKVLTRDIYNARKKYKTLREETDVVSGIDKEPVPDPNGVIPGPDGHGRWAWVPEGEEVTNKRAKRRRRTAPVVSGTSLHGSGTNGVNTTIDPQLQTPNPIHSSEQDPVRRPSNEYQTDLDGGPKSASHQSQHPQSSNETHEDTGTFSGTYESPDSSPSHFHSHRKPQLNHTPTTATTPLPASVSANEVESPAVLARIERMEKEQRDQKNLLAEILGAVKSMSGTPPAG